MHQLKPQEPEAGKGFAVVADEIRNLAEQSASTVGNIQEVTERVQTAVARLTTDAKRLLEFVGGDVTESFDDFEKWQIIIMKMQTMLKNL